MAWFVLKCSLQVLIKYMGHSYDKKPYTLNADLTFKSQTCQWRHVKSHPPDGVDLCQLLKKSISVIFACCKIFQSLKSAGSIIRIFCLPIMSIESECRNLTNFKINTIVTYSI